MYSLKPRTGGVAGPIKQVKECKFIKASVHITSILIVNDEAADTKINIPVVVVSNDNYEEDQH